MVDLRPKLAKAVQEAMKEENPDNPIYRTRQNMVMRDVAENDFQRYVVDTLSSLEDTVSYLEQNAARGVSTNRRNFSLGARGESFKRVDLTVQGDEDRIVNFTSGILGTFPEVE